MGAGRSTTGEEPLRVVAVGDPDEAALDAAADAVADNLPFDVVVATETAPLSTLPDEAYDDARDQYDGVAVTRALGAVAEDRPILAVTDADLYSGRSNYIFGLGTLGGKTALVSTFRLRTDGADSDLTRERVRKQAVTQAGRLLGADKCTDNRCPFSFSPTVREVDIADESPCRECAATLADRSWPVSEEEIAAAGRDSAGSSRDSQARDRSEGETTTASDSQATAESADAEPPGEQSKIDYLWRSLVHDLTNAGQFTGFIVGFGVSFVLSFVALGRALELVTGPIGDQSAQVIWVLAAVSLLVAWELYKLLKWVVLSAGRAAVGGLRSATE